jgi:small redox-active disulfide protein 2
VLDELQKELKNNDIKLKLTETVLTKDRIDESNSILINGTPIEELLPQVSSSYNECCSCGDLCGSRTNCKTIIQDGSNKDEIPEELIKEALLKEINRKEGKAMIQVLGAGCPSCKNLYDVTKKIVEDLKLDDEVEYLSGVEGTQKIVELGLMSSPVLLVNDKVAMVGFTPDIEKIKNKILEARK